jgi:hypothetical protein
LSPRNPYSKSLPADDPPREDFARETNLSSENYGVGEEVVVVVVSVELLPVVGAGVAIVVVVLVSVELEVAGDGFTIVVLFSVLSAGEAAGATVSVFCSHAARRAALARMQIYFFISFWIEGP